MIRSPLRTLAQLDASPAVLARAVKPRNSAPSRLERLSTTTMTGGLAVMPKPATSMDLTAPVLIRDRAWAAPEPVRPRVRKATAVVPLPPQQRFPVASLDLSRKDITLPYGVGRFTNAATVKIIAGGRRADRLMKRTTAGWEFVPDDARIDLTDNRQEFRIGQLTIYS